MLIKICGYQTRQKIWILFYLLPVVHLVHLLDIVYFQLRVVVQSTCPRITFFQRLYLLQKPGIKQIVNDCKTPVASTWYYVTCVLAVCRQQRNLTKKWNKLMVKQRTSRYINMWIQKYVIASLICWKSKNLATSLQKIEPLWVKCFIQWKRVATTPYRSLYARIVTLNGLLQLQNKNKIKK